MHFTQLLNCFTQIYKISSSGQENSKDTAEKIFKVKLGNVKLLVASCYVPLVLIPGSGNVPLFNKLFRIYCSDPECSRSFPEQSPGISNDHGEVFKKILSFFSLLNAAKLYCNFVVYE